MHTRSLRELLFPLLSPLLVQYRGGRGRMPGQEYGRSCRPQLATIQPAPSQQRSSHAPRPPAGSAFAGMSAGSRGVRPGGRGRGREAPRVRLPNPRPRPAAVDSGPPPGQRPLPAKPKTYDDGVYRHVNIMSYCRRLSGLLPYRMHQ